jgi:hypothetical protein
MAPLVWMSNYQFSPVNIMLASAIVCFYLQFVKFTDGTSLQTSLSTSRGMDFYLCPCIWSHEVLIEALVFAPVIILSWVPFTPEI